MLENIALSIVASLFLAQTPLSENVLKQWENMPKSQLQINSYESISKEVCRTLKIALFQICEIETLTNEQKQKMQEYLMLIKKAMTIAKLRVAENNRQCDKEVLYSLLSVNHILEAVLDDEFLRVTGGYKMPECIYTFGKGLLDIS